jgi:hypothetical protein
VKNGISEIDHLLTKVQQPDQAGAYFEHLGFTVTPISQIESMGLCNRLVLFEPLTKGSANFIELMGVTQHEKMPPGMADLLHGPQGVRSMVMTTPDAHAARAELLSNGYPMGEVHHIARDWVLPDLRLQVEFDVLLPVPAPFAFNLCRYFTLQHYIRPEWTGHANGIRHLEAVYCVSTEPRKDLQYYETLFGVTATGSDGLGWTVSPGQVQLTVLSLQAWEQTFGTPCKPGFVGYRLRSSALSETHRFIKNCGAQPKVMSNGDLLFAPELMFGCFVHIC